MIFDSHLLSSDIDVLAFGTGIAVSDITASRSGTSLVLSHSNGQDQVTILSWFYEAGGRYKLERFEFANGTVLTGDQMTAPLMTSMGTEVDDILVGANSGNQMMSGLGGNDTITSGSGNDMLEGGLGNDVLNAGEGNDVLIGGVGNDRLNGGQGSDRYVFNLGDGQDVISDDNWIFSGTDVLNFGVGIAASDITISRSGTSLVLSHSNDQDRVTVLNWFGDPGSRYQLERIEFADGTLWTSAQVTAPFLQQSGSEGDDVITGLAAGFSQVLLGNGGNDTLTGGEGNDRLEGGRGNDRLNGGQGSDRYVFNLGDGQDVISDDNWTFSGTDVLSFGVGIVASDITTSRSGTSLVLSHANGQDRVTILNWFYDPGTRYQLERIEFADGTLWTSAQVTAPFLQQSGGEGDDIITGLAAGFSQVLLGNGGNDTLTGGEGNDRLEGGRGNDRLNGGQGSDRYVFNLGDGQDVISDDNWTFSGTDALSFGVGIAASDITTSRSGTSLVLSHANGQDRVTMLDWFLEASSRYQVERIEFADGTLWTSASLNTALMLQLGTDGDDVMVGVTAAYNQTLLGGAGNDRITAGSGSDRLEGGSGDDRLDGAAGADTLIGGTGNDTYVVDNAGDSVQENLGEGIDMVESSISLTLKANVENLLLLGNSALNGTGNELDNVLTGNSAANILIGGGGNDRLDGRAGADTLQGGLGDDTYVVERATDVVVENVNEGIDTVESSVSLTLGNNLEHLTLLGSTALNGTGNASDNRLTGNSAANTLTGGAGNDFLDGGAGADVLVGGEGHDTYLFGRSYGSDTVVENGVTAGNADLLRFMDGIARDQLWFKSVSGTQNLEISIVGTTDKITVKDWYQGSANRVESFVTASGDVLLEAQVQNLVDAMSAFAPPPAGQTSLSQSQHAALDLVIAANWQS